VTIPERHDDIAQMDIPDIIAHICEDYVAWQKDGVVVDQIGSGV
jgi:alcohol dehydrogenase YqhD (iron-dependent ADH family)